MSQVRGKTASKPSIGQSLCSNSYLTQSRTNWWAKVPAITSFPIKPLIPTSTSFRISTRRSPGLIIRNQILNLQLGSFRRRTPSKHTISFKQMHKINPNRATSPPSQDLNKMHTNRNNIAFSTSISMVLKGSRNSIQKNIFLKTPTLLI